MGGSHMDNNLGLREPAMGRIDASGKLTALNAGRQARARRCHL